MGGSTEKATAAGGALLEFSFGLAPAARVPERLATAMRVPET